MFSVWFPLPFPQEYLLHGVFQADTVNPAAGFIFQNTYVFKKGYFFPVLTFVIFFWSNVNKESGKQSIM